MEFRNAQTADFDVILSGYREIVEVFEKRAFNAVFYRRMLEKAIAEGRNLVCTDGGNIVGFIEYETRCPNLPTLREKSAWVGWSWVDASHRGAGIGRALYDHFFKQLKTAGYERVGLDVFAVNASSQRFHEKIGFEERIKIYVKEL